MVEPVCSACSGMMIIDDTKQVCQVGTPSAEYCSKSKFFP
jgi:hypothetical protein